ncbi:hypothetical protein ACMX2H_17515 [Arthrobacter sulfonylureivorans]|uniref:hypothetical protein n=1 Tax=Arthrobacter sulfonylureivorans TaxID=2486855 RepID=UPI0039E3669C
MLGHEGVVRSFVTSAQHRLPAVIERLRTYLNTIEGTEPADELTLPVPEAENIHPTYVNLVSVGDFPAIMVTVEDTEIRNATRMISADGFWNEYEFRYPLRVLLYTMGGDGQHGLVELQRQRLMLALRTLALQYPVLFDDGEESAQIVPETIRENFTGGEYDGDNNLLLESYIRFEVLTRERLQIAPEPAEQISITHSEHLL